jgi:branched-chain amino acid transport system substrate-binding protein
VLIAAGSVVIAPIAPLADQHQIVVMNVGGQTPALAGIGKFTFSVLELADFDIQVITKYAFSNLGLKKGAILFLSNDVGKFNSVEFEKQFKALGGEIGANESFRSTDTSLGAQVAKIASGSPDFVYVVAEVDSTAAAVRQVRALMPKVQILSYGGSVENKIFLNGAGSAANGLLYTATDYDPDSADPGTKAFAAAYQAKYGSKPESAFIGYAYDAMMILAAGLDKSKAPGQPLRDAIMAQRSFPGVTGAVKFRDDGTVSKSVLIKKIADGKFETVTKVQF